MTLRRQGNSLALLLTQGHSPCSCLVTLWPAVILHWNALDWCVKYKSSAVLLSKTFIIIYLSYLDQDSQILWSLTAFCFQYSMLASPWLVQTINTHNKIWFCGVLVACCAHAVWLWCPSQRSSSVFPEATVLPRDKFAEPWSSSCSPPYVQPRNKQVVTTKF